jgi:hypothetical protein
LNHDSPSFDLVGVWRLKSAVIIDQESDERTEMYGASLLGRAIFEPNGRMIAMLVPSGRSEAASDADAAKLFRSMVAYSGRWSIDGEKFVTRVDMAWEPSWIGTEQVRYYAFDGQTLSLRTAVIELPSRPGRKVVGQLDWEQES